MARLRGFTLIELLVVIAIIGMLSSVVLASLNTARKKGNDAAIQSNLSTVLTQAELYYMSTGNYTYGCSTGLSTGVCPATGTYVFTDPLIRQAFAAAEAANGTGTGLKCSCSAQQFAVSSVLVTDTTKFWCVDSSGNSLQKTATLPNGRNDCNY